MKRSVVFQILSHLIACIAVILLFGRNCKMRMAAFPCMYKEYLSGIIVVAMTYLTAFVLFPRIFSRHSALKGTLSLLTVIFMATLAEMALVYPQVISLLMRQFPKNTAILYFAEDSLSVFFRNTAIVSFVLIYRMLQKEKNKNRQLVRLSVNHHKELSLTDNRRVFQTPLDNVVYCEQIQNYTRFYLFDGTTGYLHCSLSETVALLDNYGVQISRSVFVMLDKIVAYDGNIMTVAGENNISLKVTDGYRETADARTGRLGNLNNNTSSVHGGKNSVINGKNNRQQTLIQIFITDNPGCSEKDIMQHTSLSRSSVAKYIARLKQQGLIRHVGSNKTGGYEAANDERGEVGA